MHSHQPKTFVYLSMSNPVYQFSVNKTFLKTESVLSQNPRIGNNYFGGENMCCGRQSRRNGETSRALKRYKSAHAAIQLVRLQNNCLQDNSIHFQMNSQSYRGKIFGYGRRGSMNRVAWESVLPLAGDYPQQGQVVQSAGKLTRVKVVQRGFL